jgi:hypothetical protein
LPASSRNALSAPIRELRPPARMKAPMDFILRSYSRGVE